MGMWLDCCHTWGIEGNYFTLGQQSAGFENCLSNGYPALSRPFIDTNPTAQQDAELVAFPGLLAGRVIASASDDFQSAGLHFRHNLCCWDCCCGEPGLRRWRLRLRPAAATAAAGNPSGWT